MTLRTWRRSATSSDDFIASEGRVLSVTWGSAAVYPALLSPSIPLNSRTRHIHTSIETLTLRSRSVVQSAAVSTWTGMDDPARRTFGTRRRYQNVVTVTCDHMKTSWHKGKRTTAVCVWTPLAKKSTAHQLHAIFRLCNRGCITYRLWNIFVNRG